MLLPAERRRHRHRGAGLRHGPQEDSGGDEGGSAGPEEEADPEGELREEEEEDAAPEMKEELEQHL